MKLFLSNIVSYEEVSKIKDINNELIYLLKDDYMFFYEEIYNMVYFCKKDIIEKMKVLDTITTDFPIYSELFNLFHFSIYHTKNLTFLTSITSIETRICKDERCSINTITDTTKKFYINRKKFFVEINHKESAYPKIMEFKRIPQLLKETTSTEYDVCIKFLQVILKNFLIFEELRKGETLMKFNLTYSINYLFKFKNKQDFFEDILGESYPHDLNILKFDTGHELIQCTKLFLNKKDWEAVYNFAKDKFDKIKTISSTKLRFSGMFLLQKYLVDITKINNEKQLEDYITLLYQKKEKINLSIYNLEKIEQ